MTSRTSGRLGSALLVALLPALGLAAGCRQDMHNGPRFKPLQESDFYADKRASRPIVAGTVARGLLKENDIFYTGMVGTTPVEKIPVAVTPELIERGRTRFEIYCTPCHGLLGEGNGMVVQRGYKKPVSYHDPRLRAEKAGYFFDVMTRGFGQMPDYAAQVTPKDRWAIVAYIRALQISQNAKVADLPAAERAKLEGGAPAPAAPAAEGAPQHD